MYKETLEKLYKPFELKSRPGQGGQTFQYVESDDIIDRMNKIFEGDWSTEVVEREIIEDQIIMRVRVVVRDPATDQYFHHEGYASQFIARHNYGDKKGQPVDLGNSFKSAMSKAIKTAVSRWGVGLYLEKSSDEELLPDLTIKGNTTSRIPTGTSGLAMPVFPDDEAPHAAVPAAPKAAPKPEAPAPKQAVAPTIDYDSPPVFTNTPLVAKAAPKSSDMPPVMSYGSEDAEENLTDIQKVAIETIISVHGIKYEDLVKRALNRTDNLPQALEQIKYNDAVKIIQFGNNLK